MILLITPVNVQSPIRGHTSAQMAARERARQIQELQAQGFQKLYLLELPPSVMQVCQALPPSLILHALPHIVQDNVAQMAHESMHNKFKSSGFHFKKAFTLKIRTSLVQADSLPHFSVTLTSPSQGPGSLFLKASQVLPVKTQCIICRGVRWAAMGTPHRPPRQIWPQSCRTSWPT